MKPFAHLILPALLALASLTAQAFDHSHAAWDALLKRHVVLNAAGTASRVSYAGFQREHAALTEYLHALSAVKAPEYARWTQAQQLAFLINAYNAFTVELILTRYPKLDSIKYLGGLFSSPWRQHFFTLLGQPASLDGIEHERIRAPGVFHEPRVHAAVVCASIGCPMLRQEAYVADRLGAQLEDAMRRFLSDRSRNRFDARNGTLYVSRIFDWYGADFTHGFHGFDSLEATFAHYADALTDTPADTARVRQGGYDIEYLDYDWKLNDADR